MTKLEWSRVGNGATFQALVSILIRHEDAKAATYDRLGKDAGIDAKSGDGKRVYQYKFLSDQSFSGVLSSAKKELDKIKCYKNNTHKNFIHWKDVDSWTLVTNATINPNDQKKWDDEIVAEFKKIGFIDVSLWHEQILFEKLLKEKHIKEEFFDDQNRVFLSLAEAQDFLTSTDPIAEKGKSLNFIGRDDEFKLVEAFIRNTEKRVLPIHGAGGIGKSRFALENGYRLNLQGWDVYWANISTMEQNSNWFKSKPSSDKALLILDEPTSSSTIKVLLEQLGSNRIQNWKIIVLTRTPKDPVLTVLKNSRNKMLADAIELKPLDKNDVTSFVQNLLKASLLNSKIHQDDFNVWVARIIKASNSFPIWATVAVMLLEEGKSIADLPDDHFGLAQSYIDEFLSHKPEVLKTGTQFSDFLEILSVLQPLNIEDKKMIEFIQTEINANRVSDIESGVSNLLSRKFAQKRGRLVEIKPDVIRDYILFERVGKNASRAEEIARTTLRLDTTEQVKTMLKNLARIEFNYRYQNLQVTILDEVWKQLSDAAKSGNSLSQYNALDIATSISFANPMKLIELCKLIRQNKKEPFVKHDPTWGTVTISYDDITEKMPWAIYESAGYALENDEAEAIVSELIVLSKKEVLNGTHKVNDGKRALHLLVRLFRETSNKFKKYEPFIYDWINNQIPRYTELSQEESIVFTEIAKNLMSIEREHITSVEFTIHIGRSVIKPSHPAYIKRTELLTKIFDLLGRNDVSLSQKVELWKLVQESYRAINQVELHNSDENSIWFKEKVLGLTRVKDFLSKHPLSIREIKTAKEVWSWHLRFDKRIPLKNLATECENIIINNEAVKRLTKIFDYADYKNKNINERAIVDSLNSQQAIIAFVNDAHAYASKDQYWYGISGIARMLGENFWERDDVQGYVKRVYSAQEDEHHFSFASAILASAFTAKRNGLDFKEILEKYWNMASTDALKENFIWQVHRSVHPAGNGLLGLSDFNFICEKLSQTNITPNMKYMFVYTLGFMFDIDFSKVKEITTKIIQNASFEDKSSFFKQVFDGISFRTLFIKDFPIEFPNDIFSWIMDLLKNVPNLENFGNLFQYEFVELKKKSKSQFSIGDYASFLTYRAEKYDQSENKKEWQLRTTSNVIDEIVDHVTNDSDLETSKTYFEQLLKLNVHKSLLGYFLPEISADLDPQGLVLPYLIAEKIKNKEFSWTEENIKDQSIISNGYEWARFAGYYRINSEAWRVIAKEVCSLVSTKSEEEKKKIYSTLLDHRIRTYSGPAGEIDSHYEHDLNQAKSDLDNESEDVLKEFMKLRLKSAEQALNYEKQRLEEEGD